MANQKKLKRRRSTLRPCLRYTGRHFYRGLWRPLIMILVFVMFAVGLGWMQSSMAMNNEKIARFYDETMLQGEISAADSSLYIPGGGVVPHYVVEQLEASGHIHDIRRVAGCLAKISSKEGWEKKTKEIFDKKNMRALSNVEDFKLLYGEVFEVEYMEGYDASILASRPDGEHKRFPVLLSWETMELIGVKLGDPVVISIQGRERILKTVTFDVVGTFNGATNGSIINLDIIMPLYVLEAEVDMDEVFYNQLHYSLNPEMNRSVEAFKEEVETIINDPQAKTITKLASYLDDSVIQQSVEPLEKRNLLIERLYPIGIIVAVAVLMLLVWFMVYLSFKESVVLRVLGVTKGQLMIMLCLEQLMTVVLGAVAAAAAVSLILKPFDGMWQWCLTLGGLMLLCVMAAAVAAAMVFLGKKPMDYMRAKE